VPGRAARFPGNRGTLALVAAVGDTRPPSPLARLAALVTAAAVAGCGGGSDKPQPPRPAEVVDPSVAGALTDPAVTRMLEDCPVTRANHSIPPGEPHGPSQKRPPYYGDGRLWTVLSPRGIVVAGPGDIERDGSISMKFPWWRNVRGRLHVTGRKHGAGAAGGVRAHIPSGYGPTGFQSTGLIFASEGCWEVTGSAAMARLTFVTLVVKARPG
jgi:hypothetical protein